jgi:hypothetical protein
MVGDHAYTISCSDEIKTTFCSIDYLYKKEEFWYISNTA